jgi:hypothetical protein
MVLPFPASEYYYPASVIPYVGAESHAPQLWAAVRLPYQPKEDDKSTDENGQ